jgi:Protein of unknown function (DUF1449)
LAAGLMVVVAITEAVALLVGASLSHWGEGIDIDHPDGFAESALGWLHFGKIPILALLVIFLMTFAVSGYIAQFAARSVTGGFLPLPVAGAAAFVAAVFGVRILGGMLGRFIPRDETSAVPDASLIGRVATIVIGTARAGMPAEARVRDEHGASHYVMVEPEESGQTFASGASVLIVRHMSGRRFQAINNPKPELL